MFRQTLSTLSIAALFASASAFGGAAPTPAAPATPRAEAPVDLTGYWVSVITEDWRYRMLTPPLGEVAGIPVNQEGLRAAKEWQYEKAVADGEQCRAFGAGGVMRMPIRLHITWQDDTTLKVDIDNGQQTRLFHFGAQPQSAGEPTLQGVSTASWETLREAVGQAVLPVNVQGQGLGGGGRAGGAIPRPALSGALKAVTTRMLPGYLRRNGVPYSGDAVLAESFDRVKSPNGDDWLILTSSIEDPRYLALPYLLTTQFKKEANGSKFAPRPCELTPPGKGPSVPQ